MAFVNTVKQILPGMGSPTTVVQRAAVATNSGATTNITLPSAGSFAPTISWGKVRAKTVTVGANSTSKVASVTATDGTTTIQLYGGDAAASAVGTGIDETIDFMSDLKLTSITVAITVATANCTHDVEVAGS